jgi:hypothetical protein
MHVPHRFSGIGAPAPLLSHPLATPLAAFVPASAKPSQAPRSRAQKPAGNARQPTPALEDL